MKDESWLYEISSKRKLIDLNFKELWRYRDLLMLFVKRDIVTVYKQTVLGPLWFFIQPLFTSVIFTLVFNNIANIGTGTVPPFLFNLTGITAWNYFKNCLMGTSNTFRGNQNIFGKVYFPRAIMPLSVVISNLVKYGIQLLILLFFYIYYVSTGQLVTPNWGYMSLFPVYVFMTALIGLGSGMIVSAFTTKYRDLTLLLTFAIQLLMYVSAVPFPISELKDKKPELAWIVDYNPIAQLVEGFRFMILDSGLFTWFGFFYTLLFAIGIFLLGLIVFNRTEKTFIDTV